MKTNLSGLEQQVSQQALEEAMDLVRETTDFGITEAEPGHYHCIARQPAYHVEIMVSPEGQAAARCHCTGFQKAKHCRHTLPAMLLLRDHLYKKNTTGSAARQDKPVVADILKKLRSEDLRLFVSKYAASHHAFRHEFLAQHLHLLPNPDYPRLLASVMPLDKYGQARINRNNLKSVRLVVSTLLSRAQQMLHDEDYENAWYILQAALPFQHRLLHKLPRFRDQLATELRFALRLFDAWCRLPVAPRLQQLALGLALDISDRDTYTVLPGTAPVLLSTEPFALGQDVQQQALQIAEKKMATDDGAGITWACLVIRWQRLWPVIQARPGTASWITTHLPAIVMELSRQHRHEDVLYALQRAATGRYDQAATKVMWQEGLTAAAITGDRTAQTRLATRLVLEHFDRRAWDLLYKLEPAEGRKALEMMAAEYPAEPSPAITDILIHGWIHSGDTGKALELLAGTGETAWLLQYDSFLLPLHRSAIEDMYARHIHTVREAYGGKIARQKLSSIFDRLKANGLYPAVTEKVKQMEKEPVSKTEGAILGFVFDLDGVIVDTAEHHFDAWRRIMKELGAVIADEDDAHTRGAGRMESFEYLLDKYNIRLSQEEKETWAARKNQLYLEAIGRITPDDLLPGAGHFLAATRDAGLLLALGSASKNARTVLQKLGITDRFDAILDGNDVSASKPDPEIFSKACRALGLPPAEVVVFEDAAKGVQAALAAGCKVAGIGDPDTLSAAHIVISGLHEAEPRDVISMLEKNSATA